MTVPSGMYRTCRTGRLLNVVIFTIGPSLREKEKGRDGARRRHPAGRNLDTPFGLGRPVLVLTPDPLRADEVAGREALGRQPTRAIATTAQKSILPHRLRRADRQRADPDAPGLQNHNGTSFDTWRYFAQIGKQQIDLANRTTGCRSTKKND